MFGGDGNDTFQLIPDVLPRPVTVSDQYFGGDGTDRVLFLGGDKDRLGRDVPDYVSLRYNTLLHRYEFTSLVWDVQTQAFQLDSLTTDLDGDNQLDPGDVGTFLQHYASYQTHDVERTEIDTRGGHDVVRADSGFQFLPVTVNANGAIVKADSDASLTESWGIDEGDFEQNARIAALWISGGTGDDALFGGVLDDTIRGGTGNDLIVGGLGDDDLFGDGNNDRLFGNHLIDVVDSSYPPALLDSARIEPFVYDLATRFSLPVPGRPGVDLRSGATIDVTSNAFAVTDFLGSDGTTPGTAELRTIGNFNGDAYDDFIVVGETESYILFGPLQREELQDIEAAADIIVTGLGKPAQRFGDINGDELEDVAFVRGFFDLPQVEVTVVYGADQLWPRELKPDSLESADSETIVIAQSTGGENDVQFSYDLYFANLTRSDDVDDFVVVEQRSGAVQQTVAFVYTDARIANASGPLTKFDAFLWATSSSAAIPVSVPGDVNGDGKDEIFFASPNATLSIDNQDLGHPFLTNLTDTGSRQNAFVNVDSAQLSVFLPFFVGDVNHDGYDDIGVRRPDDFAIFLGAADLSSVFAAQPAARIAGSGLSASVGDYDGNQGVDLTVVSPQRFNRKFVEFPEFLTALQTDLGDFDNDGDLDALIAGQVYDPDVFETTFQTQILRNDGDSYTVLRIPELDGVRADGVAWGNTDEDDELEFVVSGVGFGDANYLKHVTQVYDFMGGVAFESHDPQIDLPDGFFGKSGVTGFVSIVDVDSDGRADIVVSGDEGSDADDHHPPAFHVLKNNGANSFSNVTVEGGLFDFDTGRMAWGDIDGDGDADLILSGGDRNNGEDATHLYRNDTIRNGELDLVRIASYSKDSRGLDWNDFDNDGDLDFLRTWFDNGRLRLDVYENQSAGNGGRQFVPTAIGDVDGIANFNKTRWGDFDADGDADILLSSYNGSMIFVNQDASFTRSDIPLPNGLMDWGPLGSNGDFGLVTVQAHERSFDDGITDVLILEQGAYLFKDFAELSSAAPLPLSDADVVLQLRGEATLSPSHQDIDGDGVHDLLITSIGESVLPTDRRHNPTWLHTIYGAGPALPLPKQFELLENYSVPGSGTFVVDRVAERVVSFTIDNDGKPLQVDDGDEKWFRFSTLGDGNVGDTIWLNGAVTAALTDDRGRLRYADRSVFDLRALEAGTYFLRVTSSNAETQLFTIDMAVPVAGQLHPSSDLPDRDDLHGGEGSDFLAGNQDLDRLFGDSGADVFCGVSFEVRDRGGIDRDSGLCAPDKDDPLFVLTSPLEPLDPVLSVPDNAFHAALGRIVGLPVTTVNTPQGFDFVVHGDLHATDLASLGEVDLNSAGITDLSGTEYLVNLRELNLSFDPSRGQPVDAGDDGAELYYRFDETTGTVATDSSQDGSHPGTYVGDVTLGVPGPFAENSAVEFNGANAYVETSETAFGSSRSIEIWARSNTDTWNDHGWIASARGRNGFIIHPDKDTRSWRGFFYDGALTPGLHLVGSHTPVEITGWHHYVITYGGGEAKMYFDGEEVASQSLNLTSCGPCVHHINIGRDVPGPGNPNRYGDGAVDEFAVYANRVLTPDEVRQRFLHRQPVAPNRIEGQLEKLASLPALRQLDLSHNEQITDITPLSALTDLRELRLDGTGIDPVGRSTLATLQSLVNLETLTLPTNGVAAGQNLVFREGEQVSIQLNDDTDWQVTSLNGVAISSGSDEAVKFSSRDDGFFIVTLTATGRQFPVIVLDKKPTIASEPSFVNLLEGQVLDIMPQPTNDDIRDFTVLIDGTPLGQSLTIADPSTVDLDSLRVQFTITDPAGHVTNIRQAALQFDAGDAVSTGLDIDQSLASSGVTFDVWVKATGEYGTLASDRRYVFQSNKGADVNWAIFHDGIRWGINNGATNFTSLTAFVTGEWQHVVGVFAPDAKGGVRLYVDGQRATLGTKTYVGEPISLESDLLIGDNFEGFVDEIRVWNRPLQEKEIENLEADVEAVSESELLAYWPLNEGIGSVARSRAQNPTDLRLDTLPALIQNGTDIELDSTNSVSLKNATFETSVFGESAGALGDVNGDGNPDFFLQKFFPQSFDDPVARSEVFVVFGGGDLASVDYDNLGSDGFVIDVLDGVVTGVGDINGDGFDDIAFGVPTANDDRGAVYIVYGSASPTSLNVDDLDGQNGFVIPGPSGTMRFGSSIDGIGDVSLDIGKSIDDFVVGVQDSQVAGYVVYGDEAFGPTFDINSIGSDASKGVLLKVSSNGTSAAQVRSAGDTNGDSTPDFMVGTESGVYVVFGKASLPAEIDLSTYFTPSNNARKGFRISSADAGFGQSFRAVSLAHADINADGRADILISDSGTDFSYVVYGRSQGRPDVDVATTGFDGFTLTNAGGSVFGIGDFNSDGVEDASFGDV